MFITFEGIDGSGKTTQIKAVYAALKAQGYPVLLTREPGGTSIGDQIRGVVLNKVPGQQMHPHTELLLFCASRTQLVHEVIRPWLENGGIVLCDRFADSTLAYQGYGHGLDIPDLKQIIKFATGGLVPDLTVYLDISPEAGQARRRKGTLFGEEWNRLDAMALQFHHRVYAGYEQLMAEAPERWLRVSAEGTIEVVQSRLLATLQTHLPTPIQPTE